jgi:hypothetical protein
MKSRRRQRQRRSELFDLRNQAKALAEAIERAEIERQVRDMMIAAGVDPLDLPSEEITGEPPK